MQVIQLNRGTASEYFYLNPYSPLLRINLFNNSVKIIKWAVNYLNVFTNAKINNSTNPFFTLLPAHLFKKGADLNGTEVNGNTALALISELGYTNIVRNLTKMGAKVDTENAIGETPLMAATINNHSGQSVVIAGHAGISRLILADALGLTFAQMFLIEQKYCALNIIDYSGNKAIVRLMNG